MMHSSANSRVYPVVGRRETLTYWKALAQKDEVPVVAQKDEVPVVPQNLVPRSRAGEEPF